MQDFSSKLSNSSRGLVELSCETRLLLTLFASIFSLIFSDVYSLAILLFASAVYLVLETRLKTIVIVYIIFAFMAGIAMLCAHLLGYVLSGMRSQSPIQALLPMMRLMISVNTIIPLAINARLSGMVNSLNRLKLPGIIKLPLLITIRFIPTFLNDLRQLRVAIRVRFRGRGGFFFWVIRPFLWWRVFFMPLVVRLIRSADELAMAAELKGLSSDTDFGREKLVFSKADRLVILLALYSIMAAFLARDFYA
ncbi:MAG: energy-coupling factor transporter transmembrane protein EcfT [Deltaproteobacteria bacterium]|jgi:energy-coupling factor transport system permease protein|nr:energy-coupling factor transporter transmembrane protein EcfT [Deltaproteobacteria bacterium]